MDNLHILEYKSKEFIKNALVVIVEIPKNKSGSPDNLDPCHHLKYSDWQSNKKLHKILEDGNNSTFERKSLFGIKTETLPINLTSDKCNKIIMTYRNLITFYDYGKRQDELLYGHRNIIVATAIDSSGKWLVTSDIGKNSMIIIWDISKRFPVHVIKNFQKLGCSHTQLSPCGRILLTLVEGERKNLKLLSLWDWPNKNEKPDVTIEVDEMEYGQIKKISFHHDRCNFIMLTTQKKVIFLTLKDSKYICKNCESINSRHTNLTNKCMCGSSLNWDYDICFYIPKRTPNETITGTFYDSTYVRGTSMALSGTSKGNIIAWSEAELTSLFNHDPNLFSNEKNFVRLFQLDSHSITLIYNIERFIVTVNTKGHVIFYDYNLVVAYKLADLGNGIPVNISFNLSPKINEVFSADEQKEQYGETFNKFEKNLRHFGKHLNNTGASLKINKKKEIMSEVAYSRHVRVDEWKENINPVYYISNSKRLFNVRDFMITTDHGNMYYVNVNSTELFEIRVICLIKPSVVVSHPTENLVAVGTLHGMIYLFDYIKIVLLNEADIFVMIEENDLKPEKEQELAKSITCLKYTEDGRYIGCGTSLGTVIMMDGVSLQMIIKVEKSKFPITKIIFPRLRTHFAFYDSHGEVFVYRISEDPMLIGRTKPHFMLMTDAIFFTLLGSSSLFTVGEDGYLVEYYIDESENSNCLNPHSSICFEEFAKPCHLEVSTHLTSVLMVFNDKMECRFICVQTFQVISTVMAPSCGPVSFTQYLKLPFSTDEFIFFAAMNNIGLIKMPFDGNPFRVISHQAGNNRVNSACITRDRRHAFSITENESLVLWELNIDVLNQMESLGGEGKDPYLKALKLNPSGPSLDTIHLMFEAVRDMYYEDPELGPSDEYNLIPVSEIPNFMRALGVFPTKNEFNYLLTECVVNTNADLNVEKISFENCIKYYNNYKNGSSYSEKELKEAFECICVEYNGCPYAVKPCINKDDFLSLLESEGYTIEEALTYIKHLLKHQLDTSISMKTKKFHKELPEELSAVYEFMPCTIKYEYFFNVLLGLSSRTEEIEVR